MTWLDHHFKSEELASKAEYERKRGSAEQAILLYKQAAEEETSALRYVDKSKERTLGITAVSAASLWYKAHASEMAEQVAHQSLSLGILPTFAAKQLKQLLQTIWSDEIRANAGVKFTKGEVVVAVSGGEVVVGGAPLELIMSKVKEISGIFYRTIEMILHQPLRKSGLPSLEIQQHIRPWLFQVPANSYQFAVKIQKPDQLSLFPDGLPEVEDVTQKFMDIVRASADGTEESLKRVIPDPEYRSTFLKMTRNLAPTGKAYGKMEIKAGGELVDQPVILIPESRQMMNEALRPPREESGKQNEQVMTKLYGVLRNLHLDQDWLEVLTEGDGKIIRVQNAGEAIDDIVGPMVNRRVIVDVAKKKEKYSYIDIQPDE